MFYVICYACMYVSKHVKPEPGGYVPKGGLPWSGAALTSLMLWILVCRLEIGLGSLSTYYSCLAS